MIKFFRFLIVTFFLGFLLVGMLLQTQTVRDYAKDYLIATIEAETGYKVEIADVKIYPSFQFDASNVTIYDGEEKVLHFKYLHLGVYPLAFWNHQLHLSTFDLEGVEIYGSTTPKNDALFVPVPLPYQLKIDDFFVHSLTYSNGVSPIAMKGSLFFDPEKPLFLSVLRVFPTTNYENKYAVEIAYEEGLGSLQVNTHDGIDVDAEFIFSSEVLLKIPRYHLSYGPIDFDGNLSITTDGRFTDSSLILTTGDLAEFLSIAGNLQGEGRILGDFWAPEIDLTIRSDILEIKTHKFEDLETKIISSQTKEGLEGSVVIQFSKDHHRHQFSGDILWDETLGPLPTHLTATTDLAEILHLLNFEISDAGGLVTINMEVGNKGLSGSAKLEDGFIESYQLGSSMTNIQARAEGDLSQVVIKEFIASDGNGGSYSGSGAIELNHASDFPFEFSFQLDKASFLQLDHVKATASGELICRGTMEEANLVGTITTDSVKINIPEESTAVAGSIEVTYINLPTNEKLPTQYTREGLEWPLTLDITLSVPSHAKIKGRELSSEWKGEAIISGTPAKPLVHGEFKVTEGKYRLRGKTAQINKGTITLAGDPEKKTSLYIIGEMKIDRYTIEGIVKGPLENPSLSFRSTPPLSQREILSWILFNKGIGDISSFQGTQLNQSLATLSTGTDDGPDIMSRISDTLGIDRIDISETPGGTSTVEVGKYLSEGTYVSITRSLTNDTKRNAQGNRFGLETDLGKHFKFQAEVDDDQNGLFNILWKKDY